MLRALWNSQLCRWVLVPCAVFAAAVGALYIILFVFVFGPFPKDLVEPTAGFLMVASIVLAGALVAPRWSLAVALVLCAAATLTAVWFMKMSIVSASAGALAAVMFVGIWFGPGRSPASTRWIAIGLVCGALMFLGLVALRHLDWPAQPDDLPPELRETLGVEDAHAVTFYAYDLGGFIDREWLWRIHARADLIAQVIAGLKLRRTDAVPPSFWRMAPHYWPRSLPTGAEAFHSPGFTADGRGQDGAYYFLLYDKAHQRAFVWFKNNF